MTTPTTTRKKKNVPSLSTDSIVLSMRLPVEFVESIKHVARLRSAEEDKDVYYQDLIREVLYAHNWSGTDEEA